jgi:hypothetical protein
MQHNGKCNVPAQTQAKGKDNPLADHVGFLGDVSLTHMDRGLPDSTTGRTKT